MEWTKFCPFHAIRYWGCGFLSLSRSEERSRAKASKLHISACEIPYTHDRIYEDDVLRQWDVTSSVKISAFSPSRKYLSPLAFLRGLFLFFFDFVLVVVCWSGGLRFSYDSCLWFWFLIYFGSYFWTLSRCGLLLTCCVALDSLLLEFQHIYCARDIDRGIIVFWRSQSARFFVFHYLSALHLLSLFHFSKPFPSKRSFYLKKQMGNRSMFSLGFWETG